MRALVIAAALLLSPAAAAEDVEPEPEPEPCFVPPGPPCLHISDPRLAECKLSVGACFFVGWDEAGGGIVVTRAALTIHPACGDDASAERLEQAGREHLASLQSVSVEVSVTVEGCETEGYMDLAIEEVRPSPTQDDGQDRGEGGADTEADAEAEEPRLRPAGLP